ncbi:hypothetical protein V1509DRAFT_448869 [Lipomyces kononenkoae]
MALSVIAMPAIKAPKVTLPDTAMRVRTLALTGRRVMPPIVVLSSAGFGFLAWKVPSARMAYSIAAACTIGVVPFTILVLLKPLSALISKAEVAEPKGRGVEDENWEKLLNKLILLNGVRVLMLLAGSLVGLHTALK